MGNVTRFDPTVFRSHLAAEIGDFVPTDFLEAKRAKRLDRFGIALHAGHNPGRPASHGCIRLPKEFAQKLFKETSVGTPVMIGA